MSQRKQGFTPAPDGFAFGYLLPSRATILPVDTGPAWGIFPDALTLAVLGIPPTPGGLFAHAGALPPQLRLPNFSMAPFFNETWDFVGVAFAADASYLGRTNAVRVSWN